MKLQSVSRTDRKILSVLRLLAGCNLTNRPMKKRRKAKLAELREGRPILNNGQPAKWLIEAIGQDAADAAVLFDARAVELVTEGVMLRLGEGERRAA